MKQKTSTLLRFVLGFAIAIFGLGLLVNQEILGINALRLGLAMEFIGLFLIFTCKIHFFGRK